MKCTKGRIVRVAQVHTQNEFPAICYGEHADGTVDLRVFSGPGGIEFITGIRVHDTQTAAMIADYHPFQEKQAAFRDREANIARIQSENEKRRRAGQPLEACPPAIDAPTPPWVAFWPPQSPAATPAVKVYNASAPADPKEADAASPEKAATQP